jgi:hypothetical protein
MYSVAVLDAQQAARRNCRHGTHGRGGCSAINIVGGRVVVAGVRPGARTGTNSRRKLPTSARPTLGGAALAARATALVSTAAQLTRQIETAQTRRWRTAPSFAELVGNATNAATFTHTARCAIAQSSRPGASQQNGRLTFSKTAFARTHARRAVEPRTARTGIYVQWRDWNRCAFCDRWRARCARRRRSRKGFLGHMTPKLPHPPAFLGQNAPKFYRKNGDEMDTVRAKIENRCTRQHALAGGTPNSQDCDNATRLKSFTFTGAGQERVPILVGGTCRSALCCSAQRGVVAARRSHDSDTGRHSDSLTGW